MSDSKGITCPDRTKQYLTSLQTQYDEQGISVDIAGTGLYEQVIPFSAYRVLLCLSVESGIQFDIVFRTVDGTQVTYQQQRVGIQNPFLVTQPLHFTMPTMEWGVISAVPFTITGIEVKKR